MSGAYRGAKRAMISQKNKQGWRNPWVLGLSAIILSGVLINVYLLWWVLKSPVRLLDEVYSVKEHNKHDAKWVQQQADRTALGWQARLYSPQQSGSHGSGKEGTAHLVLAANPAQLILELTDRDGGPVKGGQVVITAQWPGNSSYDFSGALYETSAGHYEGSLKFSRPGNWDLLIRAQRDERPFEVEEKVFVAAQE